jgi:hypothetical protein
LQTEFTIAAGAVVKRIILWGLICFALALGEADVFAEELVAPPEAAPAPEVQTIAKPSEGPQDIDLSAEAEKLKTEKNVKADTGKGEATAASDETLTTTLATTSVGSSDAGPPDKAFAAKVSAPHNGSFTTSIDIREPETSSSITIRARALPIMRRIRTGWGSAGRCRGSR